MDTFFAALKQDPKKRVITVETIFFSYWWDEQPELDKLAIIELVEEGKLCYKTSLRKITIKYLVINFILSLIGRKHTKPY